MFFYLLHESIPTHNNNHGKRNCKVFLSGVVLYCLLYVLLVNGSIHNVFSNRLFDALFYVIFIIFMADVAVVAYEYKLFFGRAIWNEVSELHTDNLPEWNYNIDSHSYSRIPTVNAILQPIDTITSVNSQHNET